MDQETTTGLPDRQNKAPFLVQLFSSGLMILGVLYLMGYIVVNGYQAKYLNYTADAVQLRHLAAGLLYVFLTLFQIVVVAIFLLSSLVDIKYGAKSQPQDSPSNVGPSGRFAAVLGRLRSTLRNAWLLGKNLLIAYLMIILFFTFIGITDFPGGSAAIYRSCAGWTVINLIISVVVVFSVHRRGLRWLPATEAGRQDASRKSEESKTTVALDRSQALRLVVEGLAGKWLAGPAMIFVLTIFSLVSFQGLYGRLRPDYGGGALYRVAVHLNPESKLPDHIQRAVRVPDFWFLLVDKADGFVYVLKVDGENNRNLLGIPAGEIAALEVLPTPAVHPSDVSFF